MRIKTVTLALLTIAACGAGRSARPTRRRKIGVVNVARLLQEAPQATGRVAVPARTSSPPAAAISRTSRRTSRPARTSSRRTAP